MNDIFSIALHPVNLPYTVLLAIILLYWITVVLGVLDFDFLDIEIDADVDVDVDVDIDVDADVDSDVSVGGGGFASVLTFLHIGRVPFMLYMSVLAIVLWTIAMFMSYYIPPTSGMYFFIWVAPILLAGFALAKIFTYPLKKVHGKLNVMATRSRDLLGKTCDVVTTINPKSYGQAEITHDGQHFLLTVFSNEDLALSKDSKALLIGYDPEKEAYEVSAFHH